MTDDALLGQLVDGRFRLERLLGAGGMGRVYAATQLSVGREVAVKVLRSDLSDLPTFQQRFFREAQVVASLRHPNIVGLVDFGRDETIGSLYIVMEYVIGCPLTDVLRTGRLPLVVALTVCRQICSGLAEAHAAGIVHRDLKPDNVMLSVTAESRLCSKLLDFGIALPKGRDETRFTATGAVLGTPHYMSPEQAQDQPVSERSDLYSLGVILYESITGSPPFHADTPLALLFKTVHEHHTPITDVLAGIDLPPGAVTDLLDELLSKSPDGRPASAAELGRRLDQLIAGLPSEVPLLDSVADLERLVRPAAIAIGPTVGIDAASTARDDDELVPVPPAQKPGRSLAPFVVVLVLLVVAILVLGGGLAIGLVALKLRSDRSPPAVASRPDGPVIRSFEPVDPQPTVDPEPEREPEPEPEVSPDPEPRPEPVVRPKPPKAKRPKSKGRKSKKDRGPKASRESIVCQRGTCVGDLTKSGGTAVCQVDATCDVECSGGGCRQTCQGDATCDFACAGGGCTQNCFSETTCTLSCAGGSCRRGKFGDADVVELD